ncbi:hypothetical protein [Labrys neptuniae]
MPASSIMCSAGAAMTGFFSLIELMPTSRSIAAILFLAVDHRRWLPLCGMIGAGKSMVTLPAQWSPVNEIGSPYKTMLRDMKSEQHFPLSNDVDPSAPAKAEQR